MKAGKTAAKERVNGESEECRTRLDPALTARLRRKLSRAPSTGAWITLLPTAVNGLSLSPGEFRDGMSLRYGWAFGALPKHCDGCGAKFTVEHALTCKKGGLVLNRHNEVRDELGYLACQAINPSSVRDEPIINIGRGANSSGLPDKAKTQQTTKATPNKSPDPTTDGQPFDRGDLLIRSLFDKQTSCVIDVRITDGDSPSRLSSSPAKVILSQEKEKKRKYLTACLEQRRHFAPYVCDVYGLLGAEAQAVNKRLAVRLASKWTAPYSATMGFVNARVSVAILRGVHQCLRGSRVPFRHECTKWAAWDDGAGLGLFRGT